MVIFITERGEDMMDYNEMDARTMQEAHSIEGFIGFESLRVSPMGIFISYWKDLASVNRWKEHAMHREAKSKGVSLWYDAFRSIVCPIEDLSFFRRSP